VIERPPPMSGAEKAAILLLRLGSEHSSKVLQLLGEDDVTVIIEQIMKAGSVRREDTDAALGEFATMIVANDGASTGGEGTAKAILEASIGEVKASHIMNRLKQSMLKPPFEFLHRADPRQIINFLSGEHAQTIALVLAHMKAEQSSLVLSALPEDLQREVSVRIATLDQTSPEVLAIVEAQLERRLSSALKNQSDTRSADGVQTLIDILNRSDHTTERSIFAGLEQHNEELADEVRSRMFVFDDILTLDDRAIQLVLRNVDAKNLATALKGVRAEVKGKISKNMSERAAQNLDEEIVLLGAVRMKTVEEAQAAIVRAIRALEESGQLVVSRGNDEYVS
jgi:flagellar motor switch protein FliG